MGKKNGLELGFGKVGMVQLICALGGEVFSSESGTGLAQEVSAGAQLCWAGQHRREQISVPDGSP